MLSLLIAVSLFYVAIQCKSYSLSQFTLIESPSLPYHGAEWATYSNETSNEIWLLSPVQGEPCCSAPRYVLSYNIETNTFNTETPVPEEFSCLGSHCSVAVGTTIYFNNKNYEFGSYDIKTEQYIAPITPTLPMYVKNACLTSDGRYVYVIGGQDSSSYRNYFQIYDIQQNQWLNSIITPYTLSTARVAAACQIYNGTIYVFGGRNNNGISSIESIYVGFGDDVSTNLNVNNWNTLTAVLSVGRYGIGSTICNNIDKHYVYLIGGYDPNNLKYSIGDILELFNMNDNTLTTLPFELNQVRYAPAVICLNQYIYVMGGQWNDGSNAITGDDWEISNALYTMTPTHNPSQSPSMDPSNTPTIYPSNSPSMDPSQFPSMHPSQFPTIHPSVSPTTLQPTHYSLSTTETSTTSISIQPIALTLPNPINDETTRNEEGDSHEPGVTEKIDTEERDEMDALNMLYFIIGGSICGCIMVCLLLIIVTYRNKRKHKSPKEQPQKIQTFSANVFRINSASNSLDSPAMNAQNEYLQHTNNLAVGNDLMMNDIIKEMERPIMRVPADGDVYKGEKDISPPPPPPPPQQSHTGDNRVTSVQSVVVSIHYDDEIEMTDIVAPNGLNEFIKNEDQHINVGGDNYHNDINVITPNGLNDVDMGHIEYVNMQNDEFVVDDQQIQTKGQNINRSIYISNNTAGQ